MEDIFETEGWKNRWVEPKTGQIFKVDSAIEDFFWEELKLFDRHLGDLNQYPARIEDLLQATRARIADPINSAMRFDLIRQNFLKNYITLLEKKIECFEEHSGEVLREHPQLYQRFIDTNRQTINFYRTFINIWTDFLNEFNDRNPKYGRFIVNLAKNIVKRNSQKKIITLRNYLLEDENVRNEIYRDSFTKEDSWLLNWEVKFRIRNSIQNHTELEYLKSIYDSSDPDIKAFAYKLYIDIISHDPSDAVKMRGDMLYEEAIPGMVSTDELTAFEEVVEGYLEKRIQRIFY
ncbi:MAG: hypothetical protein AABY22_14955 [Nanoarchaeota archaeon]